MKFEFVDDNAASVYHDDLDSDGRLRFHGDAVDLRIMEDVVVKPNEISLLPLGIRITLHPGSSGLLMARSSTPLKHGVALANGVGLIDFGYRGELKAAVYPLFDKEVFLEKGLRLFQLLVVESKLPFFELGEVSVEETSRGEGGFGSTGEM